MTARWCIVGIVLVLGLADPLGAWAQAPSPCATGQFILHTPVTTQSTVGVATGAGVTMTPVCSGTIVAVCNPLITNLVKGDGAEWWLFFTYPPGTGLLPAGTPIYPGVNGSFAPFAAGVITGNAAGVQFPTSGIGLYPGLTLGVPYTFELGFGALVGVGGIASIVHPNAPPDPVCVLWELFGVSTAATSGASTS